MRRKPSKIRMIVSVLKKILGFCAAGFATLLGGAMVFGITLFLGVALGVEAWTPQSDVVIFVGFLLSVIGALSSGYGVVMALPKGWDVFVEYEEK